jgi:hypothetical protein
MEPAASIDASIGHAQVFDLFEIEKSFTVREGV